MLKKVVLALIENNGELLLINRLNPHLKLTWAFPGGVMEGEESEEEAVVREAREEVGLDIKVEKKLPERKHPNTLVEISYFECKLNSSNDTAIIGEPNEIKEVKWVPANEVLNYFTSDVHTTIKIYLSSLSPS